MKITFECEIANKAIGESVLEIIRALHGLLSKCASTKDVTYQIDYNQGG
jgi:hypothetical protein